MAVAWTQVSFRISNDDGSETTAAYAYALNANGAWKVALNLRLRFLIRETGSTTGTITPTLYYSKNAGAYTRVNASSLVARPSASPNFTDGAATTRTGNSRALGSGTFVAGSMDSVDGAMATTGSIAQNSETEVEFCIQLRSADLVVGNTVAFQVRNGTTALGTYTATPTITVQVPTSIAVPLGAVALSGKAPAYKKTALLALGVLALAGLSPAVGMRRTVTVPHVAVAIAGQAPSWQRSITSGPGSMALAGQAPSKVSGPVVATGALLITGKAAAGTYSLPLPKGSLGLAGNGPALSYATPIAEGAVLATGRAPAESYAIRIGNTAVEIAGQGPALIAVVPVPSGSVAVTGQSPLVNVAAPVPSGTVALSGRTPALASVMPIPGASLALAALGLRLDRAMPVPAASLATVGYAVRSDMRIALAAGSLGLMGLAPVADVASGIIDAPGTLAIVGAVPALRYAASVPSGTVAFYGQAPALIAIVPVGQGSAELTGYAVTVGLAGPAGPDIPTLAATIDVGAGSLVIARKPVTLRIRVPLKLVGEYSVAEALVAEWDIETALTGEWETLTALEGGQMAAKIQPVTLTAANYRQLLITVLAPPIPPAKIGLPVDLTGFTADWYLRPQPHDKALLVKSTLDGGVVIEDQVARRGQMTVTLEEGDTRGLQGLYWHECKCHDDLGHGVTVVKGQFTIEPSAIEDV